MEKKLNYLISAIFLIVLTSCSFEEDTRLICDCDYVQQDFQKFNHTQTATDMRSLAALRRSFDDQPTQCLAIFVKIVTDHHLANP